MPDVTPLLLRFDRGMRTDEPRDRMRPGSVWNLRDYLPDIIGAPARKRGGTTYASANITSTHAGTTSLAAVAYAPFSGGAKKICIGQGGEFFTIAAGAAGAVTDVGAAFVPLQTPVFHSQKLIIPASDGTTAPKYYDGTTLGNLAGSPPAGKYAAVYNDRTVIANTSAKPTYAYFSAQSDPTTWNTTTGYQSFSQPITGLAALPGAMLMFMADQTARVIGSTPPPGTDQQIKDPLFNIGCSDARSIAVTGAYAIFANALGVWRSDGSLTPQDLTAAAGLSRYWRDLMASYSSTWTIAGGVDRNFYIVSVMDGATFKDAFMFDLADLRGWRVANFEFVGYARAIGVTGEELFAADRGEARMQQLSSIFSPAAGVKNDADGTAVVPLLETAYYGGKQEVDKVMRALYPTYYLTDAATDNPTITVSYIKRLEDAYTALAATLPKTTRTEAPARLWLGGSTGQGIRGPGVALRLQQNNASADTQLRRIGIDIDEYEGGRLAA